jgi:hypothetical protein
MLSLAILAACDIKTPAAQGSPQISADPAADFVRNLRLGANLESMANTVAAATHTNGMIPPGSAAQEIKKLLPKYQSQWDANLAKAYSKHLSASELESLAREGRASAFVGKLKEVEPLISADMQEMSQGILTSLATEALTNAFRGSN